MAEKNKLAKIRKIITENNFFVVVFEITRRLSMVIYSVFCKICTWIKLRGNGVKYSDLSTNGIPMIEVSIGGKFIIGNNFHMQNGRHYNKIGRQQPCIFTVAKGGTLTFGENVGISHSAFFCTSKITLGNNVMIGGNCVFYDTDFHSLNFLHRRDRLIDHENQKSAPILIHDDVFIGAHSTILKGVTIGEKSIIGAGSIVSKSIPPNEIWAGNPIAFIRSL